MGLWTTISAHMHLALRRSREVHVPPGGVFRHGLTAIRRSYYAMR